MYGLIQAWGSKIVPQVYLKPLLKNLITSAVVAALNSLVSVRPLFLFENEAITDGHQKLQDFRKSHWGILRTILKPRDFHNSNHPAIVCCTKSPINVCWPLRAWLICLQISFCFFFFQLQAEKKKQKERKKIKQNGLYHFHQCSIDRQFLCEGLYHVTAEFNQSLCLFTAQAPWGSKTYTLEKCHAQNSRHVCQLSGGDVPKAFGRVNRVYFFPQSRENPGFSVRQGKRC